MKLVISNRQFCRLLSSACFFFALASVNPFQAVAKEITIEMKSISFAPKSVNLSAGDSVVWKNGSYTEHSATGDAFDTGLIKPKNASKPIAFSKPGTYAYHCKVHGQTMSAVLVVAPGELNSNPQGAK